MSSVPLLYRVAVRAMRACAPLLARGESKVSRGIRGRRDALGTLEEWGHTRRDPARPTVWFHAPSVGEGLLAGAVVRALRVRRPDVQVVATHFSPSAEGLGARVGADVATYLPWDVRSSAERALDALQPSVLAFAKTEVWPVLVDTAKRRGTRVVMIGGHVTERSGRLRWPARRMLRSTWKALDLVCASRAEDGQRLLDLGVNPAVLEVTGDPSVDSAAHRVAETEPDAPYLAPFREAARPVVVAGSTWPADETVLSEAWTGVRKRVPFGLLVVAPHGPTRSSVASLLHRFGGMGLRCARLHEVERRASLEGVDVVIVDRVGILAHLYTVAEVAFVGGGFGTSGLHSVLEPAAAGVPTVFGPRGRSPAAVELSEQGGAVSADGPGALEEVLVTWLSEPGNKRRAAARALDYIDAHCGAAERTATLLEAFIGEKRAE